MDPSLQEKIGDGSGPFRPALQKICRGVLLGAAILAVCASGPARAGEPGNADDWYNKSMEDSRKKREAERTKKRETERLNAKYGPLAAKSAEALRAIAWPAPQSAWPGIKDTIARAETLAKEIDRSDLTVAPGSAMGALKSQLTSTRSQILSTVRQSLKGYHSDGSTSFFKAYPVEVTDQAFRSTVPVLRPRLAALPTAQLEEINERYGRVLPEDFEAELAEAHFRATLRRLGGTERESSLQIVLRAVESSASAGFATPDITSPRIVVAALDDGQAAGEFAVRFDNDLPFKTVRGSFDGVMADPAARDADVLVLLSVGSSALDREVGEYESVKSEYRTGTRTVPNPAYAAAQVQAQQATVNYQKTAINSSIQNAQYCSGWGCIGKLIGQAAAAAAESDARANLEAATRRLRATPATIDEPVYSPYAFRKVTIRSTKTAVVRYDIIDRRDGQHSFGSIAERATNEETVLYGLKEEDRNHHRHTRNASDEETVIAFESESLALGASKVLASYHAGGAETKAFKGAKALRKVLKTEPKRTTVAAKTPLRQAVTDDRRFNSAVVIQTPTSQGSGFYVEDDLVLTNLHVVDETKFVEIQRFDGSATFGKVIAGDARLDLALIRVQATGTPVAFYSKSSIPLGETVHAVGHPSGLTFTLTRGIVSSLRELDSPEAPADPPVRYIQTDTPINPGNSGGPLYLGDKVIGVNVAKLTALNVEGIGFAIHHEEARQFVARNRSAQ